MAFLAAAAALLTVVTGARLKVKRHHSLSSCGIRGGGARAESVKSFPNISIVNGQPAKECEWRWQVGLRWKSDGAPWCGGQLIHPEWVLTAAHCVRIPNFQVVAGEYEVSKVSGNEQSRWAAQVYRHPQYNARTIEWDFALVRLESAVEINECVGTVCLPTEGDDVAPGTACWISGWGRLFEGGPSPDVLQEGQVATLSNEDCKKTGYNSSDIYSSMLCAQGRNSKGEITDACQGDSGGPLVCQSGDTWSLYGATSWGQGCAGENHPGIWARVHEAVGWIEETLETNSEPIPTRAKCPDFALNEIPDSDGDCQCHFGQFCSVSNGAERDCPTASGAIGGWGGTYFEPSCENCKCYSSRRHEAGELVKNHVSAAQLASSAHKATVLPVPTPKSERTFQSCGVRGASGTFQRKLPNISIVNGQPATECEWRWQVGLRWGEGEAPWCGGQLIHPDWVLTAAHCVSTPNFNVVAGEYQVSKVSGKEQSRWAAQVHRHPQYNPRTMENDFALVRLEAPVEITDCVGTVCLPTEGADVAPGSTCWITGWGKLYANGPSPDILQEGQVRTMSNRDCVRTDYNSSLIFDTMLCAQGRNANGDITDACQGDSGGPLVCEGSDQTWSLYGATSWGEGCAGENQPGVWARVHTAIGWIGDTLDKLGGPIPPIAKCPDFARRVLPDSDGDCQCDWGQFCSVSGGAKRDCPTASGSIGGWGGGYFVPDCEDCKCYPTSLIQGKPVEGGADSVQQKAAPLVEKKSQAVEQRLFETCGIRGGSGVRRKMPNTSVVNGQPAKECEWRWQVGLRWNTGEAPWCGGQLIHPDWVLTAAHCVRTPNFNVVAGEYQVSKVSGKEQSRWAAQVHQHPQYNSRTMENDFALVRLEAPMEITDCVGTVCLPTEGADVAPGSTCWITGWGKLYANGPSPDILQEGQVRTMSNRDCVRTDYNSSLIFDSMLCAQGRNANGDITDACQGDSGGPLVCEGPDQTWSLYGATSWGEGCAGENHPGVWARIHTAIGWIGETLDKLGGPIPPIAKCPDFARRVLPDSDGDCQCDWRQFCSRSGGSRKDCPTASGSIGGFGGVYFVPTCEDCKCYPM